MMTEQTRTLANRMLENQKKVAEFAIAQNKVVEKQLAASFELSRSAAELAVEMTNATVDAMLPKKAETTAKA